MASTALAASISRRWYGEHGLDSWSVRRCQAQSLRLRMHLNGGMRYVEEVMSHRGSSALPVNPAPAALLRECAAIEETSCLPSTSHILPPDPRILVAIYQKIRARLNACRPTRWPEDRGAKSQKQHQPFPSRTRIHSPQSVTTTCAIERCETILNTLEYQSWSSSNSIICHSNISRPERASFAHSGLRYGPWLSQAQSASNFELGSPDEASAAEQPLATSCVGQRL